MNKRIKEEDYYQLCCDVINLVDEEYNDHGKDKAKDFALKETKRLDDAKMEDKNGAYAVNVCCENCGFKDMIDLPKGLRLPGAKCPHCGCYTLNRTSILKK